MLATLVTAYTEAIRQGHVPCIESALKSLALIENKNAASEASTLYIHLMEKLPLPTNSDDALNDYHFECLQKALKTFHDKAILDENNDAYNQLMVSVVPTILEKDGPSGFKKSLKNHIPYGILSLLLKNHTPCSTIYQIHSSTDIYKKGASPSLHEVIILQYRVPAGIRLWPTISLAKI